ncbi:hypothetical protein Bbelb_174500 [Branchiostoma belcheri]|nr:hypothetical protein Bbelb_174500 [Branchiostoma belcheri]
MPRYCGASPAFLIVTQNRTVVFPRLLLLKRYQETRHNGVAGLSGPTQRNHRGDYGRGEGSQLHPASDGDDMPVSNWDRCQGGEIETRTAQLINNEFRHTRPFCKDLEGEMYIQMWDDVCVRVCR